MVMGEIRPLSSALQRLARVVDISEEGVEELAEAGEQLMARVGAQAYALASKSEKVGYWLIDRRNGAVTQFNKVLQQGQFSAAPKSLADVRNVLSYLVELENLKLKAVYASTSTTSSPSSTPSSLRTIGQFLVLHKALGLSHCASLRDLVGEDGLISWELAAKLGVEETVDRFLAPVLELAAGPGIREALDGISNDSFGEFQSMLESELSEQRLISRQEAEQQLRVCLQECEAILSTTLQTTHQSQEKPQLQSWSGSITSLTSHLRKGLLEVEKCVFDLTKSQKAQNAALSTLKLSNDLLKNLLRHRERDLETLGEEYYSFATQNTVNTNERRRPKVVSRSESESFGDMKSPLTARLTSFPEDEEIHTDETIGKSPQVQLFSGFEKMEKLAIALHRDCDRQTDCFQSVLKLWAFHVRSQRLITDMSQSALGSGSLEGAYKAQVIRNNPIASLFEANVLKLEDLMPSYELFPVLFQIFDSVSMVTGIEKTFPEAAMEHLSLVLPVQVRVHQFLGTLLLSLQTYYSEGLAYAVFFARLMHVFSPDPLLPSVALSLYRLNAYLLALESSSHRKAVQVRMVDEEAGGNVFLSNALDLAFRLPFAGEIRLLAHFLACVKPQELSTMEWIAFVVGCKADFLMMDLTTVEVNTMKDLKEVLEGALGLEAVQSLLEEEAVAMDALHYLVNPQVYADIKGFLCVPRGYLMDAFLQVYDLYIDSLFPLISLFSSSRYVSEAQYFAFLYSLHPALTDEERLDQWHSAQCIAPPTPQGLTKDAVHLSIILSSLPLLAAKPLYLSETELRLPRGHAKTVSFGYRNGRLALSFREQEAAYHRRNLSQLQNRYGRVRCSRDFAALARD